LSNETVEVLIVGSFDTQIAAAYIIDSLVVHHETTVRVLQGGVGGQDWVVRFHHSCGNLGSRVDTEFQLALLSIVDGQTFHQQGTKSGTRAATEGVEDQEPLEARAVVCHATNLVEDLVNQLFTHSVVAAGVVVGGILLTSDHLLGVEQVAIWAVADLVDDIGLEVAVDRARHKFAISWVEMVSGECLRRGERDVWASTSFGEESAETLVGVLGFAFLSQESIRLGSRGQKLG
jgi:hypothetical protein